MNLFVKKLHDAAHTPTRGGPLEAGVDLYALEPLTLNPGDVLKVRTGVAVKIPTGHVGLLKDRSSLGAKGLHVLAGVIDETYTGELLVVLVNLGRKYYEIRAGDRIAQLLILPHAAGLEITPTDTLEETCRGDRGFGSTGV